MKILIIGAQGFIGSNCIKYFQKIHEVWQVGTLPNQMPDYFQVEPTNSSFDAIFSKHNFDVCINASGSAHVGYSFENPEKDFELNVLNVNKLLVAIRRYNPACKFINFSSAAVYGNPKQLPIEETALNKPLSPYGFHKLQSEYLLREYHKFFGLHTCSLRVFSAYGMGLKKQLFWDLYQKSKKGNIIDLFGSGEETRDFIFIDDLIKCIDLVITQANFEGEAINVASGIETKIKDAVNSFYKILNPEIKVNFSGKVRIGDPNNWRASIKTIEDMGFKAEYSMETGLKHYIKWLKKQENE